jgi:membrane-associated phospholipid phosphatase
MALGAVALVALAWVFDRLAGPMLSQGDWFDFDVSHADWLHAHQQPVLTLVMRGISLLHGTAGILVLTALVAAAFARSRGPLWALRMALLVPGGMLLNVVVKLVVGRARPSFDGIAPALSSYSFPSGHTAEATVFYGVIVAFVWATRRAAAWRWGSVVVAMLAVCAVAASRLYLGAHYTSDVLVAMFEGLCWLGICLGGTAPRGFGPQQLADGEASR